MHNKLLGIERKHLNNQFRKSFDIASTQHKETVDKLKQTFDERVGQLASKGNKALRESEREKTSQISLLKDHNREDRENILLQHRDQMLQLSNATDGRIRRISDTSNKTQKKLEKHYSEALDSARDNYMERLLSLEEKKVNDQTLSNKIMSNRLRNLESSFNNKFEQTIKSYENKISQMQEVQAEELKNMEKMYKERSSSSGKAAKIEKESIEAKYELKISQMRDQHNEQLDRLRQRHQEEMQNLTAKASSYSRKA